MRAGNVTVILLGVLASSLAVAAICRWGGLSNLARRHVPAPTDRRLALRDAIRVVGVVSTAGLISGLLVGGLFGRLVMRVLAATSGDAAQGRLTEAGETVGRITEDGTVAFIVFIGLFSGILVAVGLLMLRRWLPRRAAAGGAVLGMVLLGTAGVSDPLSPDNVDFAILRPAWLAVALVVTTGLMLGMMGASLAARLDGLSLVDRPSRWLAYPGLILAVLPSPLLLVAVGYIAGRAAWPGRLAAFLDGPNIGRSGRALTSLGVLVATITTAAAAIRIVGS